MFRPAGARPPVVLSSLAAQNGGYDNFNLYAVTPSESYSTTFGAEWNGTSWVSGSAAARPDRLVVRPGSTASARIGTSVYRRALAFANAVRVHGIAEIVNAGGCVQTTTVLGTQTGVFTTVGEVHTASDANETFYYGKYADSSIDVGSSTDDSGFGIEGTTQISNEGGNRDHISVAASKGYQVQEEFDYQHTKVVNDCTGTHYYHEASQWDTGIQLGVNNHSLDGDCPYLGVVGPDGQESSAYGENAGHATATQTAVHWSVAVTVFGASGQKVTGVPTSSQTGRSVLL